MQRIVWTMLLLSWCGCAARRHYPISDHCDGTTFRMPGIEVTRGLGDVLRWQLFDTKTPWPTTCPKVAKPHLAEAQDANAIVVTFVGHATHLIQHQGRNVLTDPIFSQRASPVSWAGPKRLCPPGIAWADLPRIDVVVISHNHYDHLDLPTLARLEADHHPMFVVPLGTGSGLEHSGLTHVVEMDWYQAQKTTDGAITITATPAQHWSMRSPFDRNHALWAGYMLEVGRARIFFAGDTGMGPHFKAIRDLLGPMHLALLPIGAYCPRWFMAPQHMDPTGAVQACIDLGAPQAIGTHYGTFQLANEGLDDPARALAAALQRRQMPQSAFVAPCIGESVRVPIVP